MSKEIKARHPFATKEGIYALFGMLIYSGDMCPKCGHGTRKTSKNWARCKKCDHRVARKIHPSPVNSKA